MNISPLPSSAQMAGQSLEALAGNPNVSNKDKVGEVARQFEAYLLRQYLGEARKTLVPSKFNPDSQSQHVYQDMITSQLADTISKTGTLGLGTLLQEQLTRQNLKLDGTAPADPLSSVSETKLK